MQLVILANQPNLSFIENELSTILMDDRVTELHLFSDFPLRDESIRSNPKLVFHQYNTNSISVYKLWLLPCLFKEWFTNPSKYKTWHQLLFGFKMMINEVKKTKYIAQSIIPEGSPMLAYWASNEAFMLAWLRKGGFRNLMLTRMHAFDIYEEFDNNGSIAWRWFINKHIDRFITISKHGEKYFGNKYPQLSNKIFTHYLGINHLQQTLNTAPAETIRVVSCGWVGRRKNLNQVFYSLRNLNTAEWIHIGGGEEFIELKQLVSSEYTAFKVSLMGSKSPAEIENFYMKSAITCFISLSTNEGLPVSMMEAMAFGIPVVSTDVGGCSEIVNENTGVLLPKDYTDEDVRNAVRLCAEKYRSPEARKRIQDECRRKFDAKTNYGKFVDFMISENEKYLKSNNSDR